VTTPAQPPPQQQVPAGQQVPPPPGLDDPALPLAVAAVLVAAVSAATAVETLKATFVLSAAALTAMTAVLGDVMQHPPPVTGVIGAASAQTSRVNLARRAQYVIAAAKRTSTAASDARAKGKPALAAVRDHLAKERRWYEQHQAAMWNRARAAGQTDMAAAEHGPLLGWNTVIDKRTSAECKAADGWNFHAASMPDIGFPGAVHPGCRCFPSAPHPGGRLLPGSRAPRYARAA
jgi:hypothetical protein